jgi:aromatic ring-opening dioxygenase LigB subunit
MLWDVMGLVLTAWYVSTASKEIKRQTVREKRQTERSLAKDLYPVNTVVTCYQIHDVTDVTLRKCNSGTNLKNLICLFVY